MKRKYIALTLLATTMAASGLTADPVESSLDSAFAQLEEAVPGKFSINTRLRYEIFDLDNGSPALDRDGTSLRVRYGYTTPDFNGFTAMAEGETLTRVGGDHDDIHPLDDAGDGTDLNQIWVQYQDADYGSAKVGRQIYFLDDHRFIGHVGWRQNIQTFDAATAAFTAIDNLTIKAFYIDAVNRVNADYFVLVSFGLNASYSFNKAFNLTGFYYEIDNADNPAWESDVIGLRATGVLSLEDIGIDLSYALSVADQDNADTGNANYFAGDLSTKLGGVTLGAGFEVLNAGFSTPLATVHKFNGFADVFAGPSLGGIANGLEDYYAYAGYTIPVGNGINAKLIYHDFSPETGAGDYGDEIDLVASYKINEYFSTVAKYGSYNTDGGSGGVGGFDKDMFTIELNFIY
ncbi:MAG: alginate export family protein [Verrucomicrobia bacterium]|nr:alginate export family protein [Verrucomicrobiota bacterium]